MGELGRASGVYGWLAGEFFDGFEVVEDFFGGFAAFFGVADEGDSMGAEGVDHGGVFVDGGFDYGEVAEHGMDEEVGAGSVFDEIEGDVAKADVAGGANGGFEIAVSPIPDSVEESGVFGVEGFDFGEVGVGDANELLDEGVGEGRGLGLVLISEVDEGECGGRGGEEGAAGERGLVHVRFWRLYLCGGLVGSGG